MRSFASVLVLTGGLIFNSVAIATDTTNQSQSQSASSQSASEADRKEATQALAVLIAAWNPRFGERAVYQDLVQRAETQGIERAVLGPAIVLLDMAYTVNRPEVAKLVNTVISKVSPELGYGIEKQLGLPTREPSVLDQRSGRLDLDRLRASVYSMLGDRASRLPPGLEQLGFEKGRSLIGEALLGPGAFVRSPMVGHEMNDGRSYRGPFGGMEAVAYRSCEARCREEAMEYASNAAQVGAALGGSAGAAAGSLGGFAGAAAGGAVGGAFGGALFALEAIRDSYKPCISRCEDGTGPQEPKPQAPSKEDKPEKDKEKDKDKDKDKEKCDSGSDCKKGTTRPVDDDLGRGGREGKDISLEELRRMKGDPVRNPGRDSDGRGQGNPSLDPMPDTRDHVVNPGSAEKAPKDAISIGNWKKNVDPYVTPPRGLDRGVETVLGQ
jgi:hypothetical protein